MARQRAGRIEEGRRAAHHGLALTGVDFSLRDLVGGTDQMIPVLEEGT